MSTAAPTMPPPADTPKPELSQPQRILNTFFDPVKTFTDLKRGTAWWMAFVLIALSSYALVFVASSKLSWEQIAENQMKMNPKQAERMEKLDPAQRAQAERMGVTITKAISYTFPALLIVIVAVMAVALWGTFNFGFGGDLTFGRALAVLIYAHLVGVVKTVLVIITLFAGANPENFTFQNPIASNLGFFVNMAEHPALYTLATAMDIFVLWSIVLTGIGVSCVSRIKRGTAIAVVFGWYVLVTLPGVILAAL